MANLFEVIRFYQRDGIDHKQLQHFTQLLRSASLPHRLAEEKGDLVLWVYQQDHVALCEELYKRFLTGELDALEAAASNVSWVAPSAWSWRQLLGCPVTVLICLMSMAGFALLQLQWWPIISLLSFQGLSVEDGFLIVNQKYQVWQLLKQGEVWRLFTPIFLHFGFLHIIFNLVLFVFFARQIEQKEGSFNLLSHILILALISNLAQFWFSADQLFGGLSGVVYGVMAYCWLINILRKQMFFVVPQGLMVASIIMIALSLLGMFSLFGMSIANWAHILGLLTGLLLAVWKK